MIRSEWLRLLLGLALVFALFHWSADALGSDRGQSGVIVGALVVAATIAVEWAIFGQPALSSVRRLGLGRPRAPGLAVAGAVALLLWFVVLVFALVTGASVALAPGWARLGARPLRSGRHRRRDPLSRLPLRSPAARTVVLASRSSLHAAICRGAPAAVSHHAVADCARGPGPVRGAVISAGSPLRVGSHTIWAPALLHFVIQATVKVIVVSGDSASVFPLVWMAASAVFPMFVLLIPRR